MPKDKIVSVFLVLLVSAFCPAACGMRTAAASESTPATDCCGHRLPPHGPGQPTNQPPDACFCSTQGVTIDKADAFHLPVLPSPFTSDAPDKVSPNAHPASGAPQPFRFHPPNQQRVLPLLI